VDGREENLLRGGLLSLATVPTGTVFNRSNEPLPDSCFKGSVLVLATFGEVPVTVVCGDEDITDRVVDVNSGGFVVNSCVVAVSTCDIDGISCTVDVNTGVVDVNSGVGVVNSCIVVANSGDADINNGNVDVNSGVVTLVGKEDVAGRSDEDTCGNGKPAEDRNDGEPEVRVVLAVLGDKAEDDKLIAGLKTLEDENVMESGVSFRSSCCFCWYSCVEVAVPVGSDWPG
jgi:hypothetical protein